MQDDKSPGTQNKVLEAWLNRKKKKPAEAAIQAVDETIPAVLSYGQQRLWLLQQLYPDNPFYQYSHLYRFEGPLNREWLQASFESVIERHSILRTTFFETEEGVRQVADPAIKPVIAEKDLTGIPAHQQEEEARAFINATIAQPFVLDQGPLFRLTLLKFSETRHWLIFDIHHIIGDRWSLEVINAELAEAYLALEKTGRIESSALPFQYADYARRQRSRQPAGEDLNYWLKQLGGELPGPSLPTDHPRPPAPSFRGAMVSKKLPSALSEQLKRLSKEKQVTSFVVLLSAFKTLLYRYTNQTDILVGSPFSNRDRYQLEQLAGFFNETLVLRSSVSADLRFSDLLNSVKQTTLEALSHKNVPFDLLVQKLHPERQGGYNPLFQTMFLYNTPVPLLDFGNELQVAEEMLELGVAKFDLTLHVDEQADGLKLTFEYAEDLFVPATVNRMLMNLETLLQSIVARPEQAIKELPLLPPAERQKILTDWNSTRAPLPDFSSIHQLMEERAAAHPDQPAVIDERGRLTYAELNNRSTALARRLLAEGLSANTPVGLYTRRSVELFVGIFGILKAGGAYLPLDSDYPAGRIEFMLTDSKTPLVLSQQELLPQLSRITDIKSVSLDPIEDPDASNTALPQIESDQQAYLIYTSGSTGRPKGVPVTHRNLLHSTVARFSFYPEPPACFLLLSSFSFDSSVAGIFWTLCSGGTLLLPKKRIEQDVDELSALIEQHAVSHTLLLPSLYGLLLAHAPAAQLQSLQTVIVAGEACSPELVRQHIQLLPQAALYNEYGPTEATVWCIAHRIASADGPTVPIGRPIPNMQAYLLDEHRQPVPVGVAGELFIAGAGLTSGYLNRPELTEQRFVANPFSGEAGAKMYKTGDLARFTEDGVIEFLGRVDHQIKIRGYRVEPDEIKNQLLHYPGVTDAIVLTLKPADPPSVAVRLVAYLSGIEQQDIADLKRYLGLKLPDYMVPSVMVPLAELPRLPNGKVDRTALPEIGETNPDFSANYTAPNTPLEIQLAEIWQEVLTLDRVGIHSNFFQIGGDSLLSIKIVAKARQAGIEIAADQLFQNQTIAELARSIEGKSPSFSELVPLKSQGNHPPLFCIHSGGAHVFFYTALADHLPEDQPVYALQPPGLDDKAPYQRRIEEMAASYIEAIRTVQPQGPYHLLGTCFSNAVALEMGNQLIKSGEQVAGLFIIDSGPVHLLGDADLGKHATLKRFLDLLKRGDFHRIKRKIMNRLKPTKRTNETWEAIAADDGLREMVESLNRAYAQYTWSPFPGRIHFIRSSEFHGRPDKQYQLHQWNKLAGGGLEVHVVPGHHLTLFKEPEVRGLARKISACLEPVNA